MYKIKKSFIGKLLCCILAIAMLAAVSVTTAFAGTDLGAGTYKADIDMSLYVDAMGGVEFATDFFNTESFYADCGVFKDASLTVDSNGDTYVTVEMGIGIGKIYSVPFESFVSTEYSIKYYDANHELKNVTSYTVSTDTTSEGNKYVTSITYPLETDTAATVYNTTDKKAVSAGNTEDGTSIVSNLYFVLGSNVMSLQFCDGSGTLGSGNFETNTKYVAAVTVDLTGAEKVAVADESSTQSANVEYTVKSGYEIEIPTTITVDSNTGKGAYTVNAMNFVIGDNAYVTVTASESGKLTNGSDNIAFTNTLEDGKLTKTGDSLDGSVTVTESASNPGKYTGTVDFTINFYTGE